MATFMDVHTGMKGITEDQLRQEHEKDLRVEKSEGVRFVKTWADPISGTVFCLSEGPNRDAVNRVHTKAGHPTTEIYEVPVIVE